MEREITILDNTLRDGEQQALINFNASQKEHLANLIAKSGIDFIDIMPIKNKEDITLVKKYNNIPFLLSTPVNEQSIKQSLEFNKGIIPFQAVSDYLLQIRIGKPREESREINIHNMKSALQNIKTKIGSQEKIYVVGEDSSRAHTDYIIKVIKSIEEYIDGYIIADSLGYLVPEKTGDIVSLVKRNTDKPIGIHAHNDLGYAESNTISAVLAGAEIISGTFTGIGERAGNANLGNVLKSLKKREIISKKLDYTKISQIETEVLSAAKRGPARPFSKEAFYVESGIHAHALLSPPTVYSLVDPALLGFDHTVLFSKKSGISNFKWYLGNKYNDIEYEQFRDKMKEQSVKENRSYSFEEVKEILSL